MSENPLLPHRKLKELHALMLRCRDMERKAAMTGAREALLAATCMQLLPGDLLSGVAGDTTLEELSPDGKTDKHSGQLIAPVPTRLGACAAAARGLQASGADGLVLAHARAGTPEPGWQTALTWAHAQELPLVLVCEDATGGKAVRGAAAPNGPMTWAKLQTLSRRLKLPILAVDGEDAVAMYRAMQEAVIRMRHGDGPAVIWAVTSPLARNQRPRNQQPLVRLESYLKVRNILVPKR